MTDATQGADVWVTVLGQRIRLIFPGEGWTFDEALLAKEVSEGLSPVEVETRMMLADPHAWLALLRVSFERAGMKVNTADLGNVDVLALAEQTYAAVKEAARKLPPSSPSPSSGEQPGNGSPAAPSSETTSESTGGLA